MPQNLDQIADSAVSYRPDALELFREIRKCEYVVTRTFTGGTLAGIVHTSWTGFDHEVGLHIKNPIGGSPYTILMCEKIMPEWYKSNRHDPNRATPFKGGCIRYSDVAGTWWVMNNETPGWASSGFQYRTLDDLFANWNVYITRTGYYDEHSYRINFDVAAR